MSDRLERNKKAVTKFYDLMFNECKPVDMQHAPSLTWQSAADSKLLLLREDRAAQTDLRDDD